MSVKSVARVWALLLVWVGCGMATPSPSVAPLPTPAATGSPAGVPSPSASPLPTPSGSVAPEVVDLPLEIHEIPAAYTGHISDLISLGNEVVWIGGQGVGDNNLYRYVPGQAEPEL